MTKSVFQKGRDHQYLNFMESIWYNILEQVFHGNFAGNLLFLTRGSSTDFYILDYYFMAQKLVIFLFLNTFGDNKTYLISKVKTKRKKLLGNHNIQCPNIALKFESYFFVGK